MKLDLTEIALNLGKRIKYEIDEPPVEDVEAGLKCVAPIRGEATFTNSGSFIIVRGGFSTKVELECSRCLKTYLMDVSLPIEEELPLPGHVQEEGEIEEEGELPEEEREPLFVENIFDLTEMFRQSILVAVPIKPLCTEECRGLCARCGKDLNQGPCDCPPDTGMTSLAGLAELLGKDEESG